jgi:predicted DNA-binding transcriptional regulator AlpA
VPPNTPPPPYSRATTITTDRFAHLIGCSPQLVYRRLEEAPDELPCLPIRLGRRLRWPTAKVAQVLGVSPEFVVNGCPDGLDALAAAVAPPIDDDQDRDFGDAA